MPRVTHPSPAVPVRFAIAGAVPSGRRVPRPRGLLRLTVVVAALIASPGSAQTPPNVGRKTAPAAAPQQQMAEQSALPTSTGFAGIWIDDTGDGAIEIKPCAPATADVYCGNIVWLKTVNDKSGRPLRDGNNGDVKERRRPICGLPTLGGLKRQPSGALDEGWIYDPRQGQRFDLELTLKGPDKLQVVGYKGFKFLSKTFIWTRAPANQPRCQPPA